MAFNQRLIVVQTPINAREKRKRKKRSFAHFVFNFCSFRFCDYIPYTKKYARNIYLQHPDRNNLWGISDLLALYDISNVSISMSDKEDIDRLSVPFLAEFSQDLVLVTQCNSDFVEIVWKNSLVKIARQQFFRSWTGVVTPVAQVLDLPFNQRLS